MGKERFVLETDFLPRGWARKITRKGNTYRICIKKDIVVGACISEDQKVFSYLARDPTNNRYVIVTYLDGRDKLNHEVKNER